RTGKPTIQTNRSLTNTFTPPSSNRRGQIPPPSRCPEPLSPSPPILWSHYLAPWVGLSGRPPTNRYANTLYSLFQKRQPCPHASKPRAVYAAVSHAVRS